MDQLDLWEREDAVAFRRKLMSLQAEVNLAEEVEQRAKGEYGLAARRTREAHLKLRKFLEEDLRPLPLFDREQLAPKAPPIAANSPPIVPVPASEPPPGPRPITPEQIARALRQSLTGTHRAGVIWEELHRQDRGVTDGQVEGALVAVWASAGGSSPKEGPAYSWSVKPMAFWCGTALGQGDPTLAGEALVRAVREVMAIPQVAVSAPAHAPVLTPERRQACAEYLATDLLAHPANAAATRDRATAIWDTHAARMRAATSLEELDRIRESMGTQLDVLAQAPPPVEPPEVRCVCCLAAASNLGRDESIDGHGLCPDCVGAVHLGEADTGLGRLTVWSLLCGTCWAWGPFAQLGNWSRSDLRQEEYQPTVEQIAQAVGALAGRTLQAVDWWPLDSIGQMVIRLVVPREQAPQRTPNGLPATSQPAPKKSGKRKAVKS